jgi:hypothetical protein
VALRSTPETITACYPPVLRAGNTTVVRSRSCGFERSQGINICASASLSYRAGLT